MTTFFLDFANGNDSNDGTTFANRWKTVTTGATAARIAPGDTIRMIKSTDATSIGNATWTNNSRTLTLAGALTANIDLCEVAWTAATNVTASTSATRRQGTVSCSFAIAGGFGTGKIAHKDLGASTDFSAYQQVALWFRTDSTSINAKGLTLRLCSDTTGDTVVNTLSIPDVDLANRFHPVVVDNGSALGSNIRSISIAVTTDPVTPTFLIDNILACKAPSADDSITLKSLFSKNTATETWYPIRFINGTSIEFDNGQSTTPGTGNGYSGTTETVTTYKRESITVSTAQNVQDSGTSGNLIHFSGGWNSTDGTTQTGETWLDGISASVSGVVSNGTDFIKFSKIAIIRFTTGFSVNSTSTNWELDTAYSIDCTSGFVLQGPFLVADKLYGNNNAAIGMELASYGNAVTEIVSTDQNVSVGLRFNGANGSRVETLRSSSNNLNRGISFDSQVSDCFISDVKACNGNSIDGVGLSNAYNCGIGYLEACNGNTGTGIQLAGCTNCYFLRGSTATNSAGSVEVDAGYHYFRRFTFNEATNLVLTNPNFHPALFNINSSDTPDNHVFLVEGGSISSETTVRHTASGIAWKLQPTSTSLTDTTYPLRLKIASFAVTSGQLTTVKAWLRRTNTAVTGTLVVPGRQLAGVDADVTASISVAADTWEQLTVSFTPTESNAIDVHVIAYGGTTHTVYVDDLTIE